MNKLFYVKDVCNEMDINLSDDAIDELMSLYGKQFQDDVKNADELLKSDLIFYSGKYIISDVGDEVIEKAANRYVEIAKPRLQKASTGRTKRKVTQEMIDIANLAKSIFKERFEMKDIVEDRSNLRVLLLNRVRGYGELLIMNSGYIRATVYKASDNLFKEMEAIGCTHKAGTNKNTYFDIEMSEMNLRAMIKVLFKYLVC